MTYRIEVTPRPGYLTEPADALLEDVAALGIGGARSVTITRLFFVDGNLSIDDVQTLTANVLADDVVENYRLLSLSQESAPTGSHGFIEVSCKPGVTDTVAETLRESAHQLGITGVERAATATQFRFEGDLAAQDLRRIARSLLANEVVEQWSADEWLEQIRANS